MRLCMYVKWHADDGVIHVCEMGMVTAGIVYNLDI